MTTTSSVSLNQGDTAPEFELPDINMNMIKSTDLKGSKVILVFFPASDSPVCSKEMCTFRDTSNELSNLNCKIIGISTDGPFANKVFSERYRLDFPILSDYKKETINKYGIVMKDLGKLTDYNAAKRSIFVVDENGTIVYKWISDNPMIEPNYDEIRNSLQK
jgi:peroxiredoxin